MYALTMLAKHGLYECNSYYRGTLLGQTLQLEPQFSRKIEFYLVPTDTAIAPPTGLNGRNASSHRSGNRAVDRLLTCFFGVCWTYRSSHISAFGAILKQLRQDGTRR